MKEKIETFETAPELEFQLKDYNYQDLLTPKLDGLEGDFDQNIINEIVLWKVNRYAKVNPKTLELLNKIKKEEEILDEELTREILLQLLGKEHKGIRLAMASTILRFKNPNVYQIIDQRVYRFIYGEELTYKVSNFERQIEIYLSYLKKLQEVCSTMEIKFTEADRILYMLDKKWNSKKKLTY